MPQGENITTKFKVDISDLKKGIADANQQIKLANASFKAASAGMDDWQKSTDGVKAKLGQLDSVLAAEKSKLAAYVEQLNRQKQAYDENGKRAAELRAKLQDLAARGVSKTSTEYKALEKELVACEKEQAANEKSVNSLNVQVLNQQAAVNKTEKEIRQYTSTLDDMEREQREGANSSEDLGEGLKKAGDASGDASGSFTFMDGVLAGLVVNGIKAAVQGLKDLANAAYEAWQAYDAGEDIIIAATGATGEQADALVGSMENVARTVVADMGDVATAIGEVNTRFGFTDSQLEETSRQFLKFAQLNGTDVKSSVDSVQQAMAAWGISGEKVGDVLDLLNKAGQDTGESVDEITRMISANAPALQEMGIGFADATMLLANFGKSGVEASDVMAGLKKAMTNAAKDGKPLSSAMGDIEAAIKGAEDSTEATRIAMELFGAKAGPAIATAIRDGRLSFEQFNTSLDAFSGNIDTTFGETLDATDSVKLAIQNLKITGAQLFGEFLEKYGPQLESAINTFTEEILPAVVPVLSLVVEVVGELIKAFYNLGVSLGEAIGLFISGWAEVQENWNEAVQYFSEVWTGIQEALANVEEWFKETFSAAWTAIQKAWSGAVTWFKGIWTKIKNAFANVNLWFKNKFTAAWNAIKTAWSGVVSWFSGVWTGIKNAFAEAADWFGQKFRDAWAAITDAFSGWVEYWTGLWDKVRSIFSELGTKIGDAISGAVKAGINSVIEQAERVINRGIGLINDAIDLINKLPGVDIGYVREVEFPRLAQGGILRRGQVGLLEGSGAEAVVPLDQNKAWIHAVAEDLREELAAQRVNGLTPVTQDRSQTFTQIINAPKQPSRIELYRQTRNLLALAGGAASV